MGVNRYWIFDPNQKKAVGPFSPKRLKTIKGFSLETFVAPDGTQDAGAWKPAGAYEELQRLYPKPPPLPGQAPPSGASAARGARAFPDRRWIIVGTAGVLLAACLIAYGVFVRQKAGALPLVQDFPVGDSTMAEHLSRQKGSWSVTMATPPNVWRVVYRSEEDWPWLVDVSRREVQPLSIDALVYSVPALYAQYSKRIDAEVSGADLGPIKELERYKCGEKDCLEASSDGEKASSAEFDTLPWLRAAP